MTDDHIGSRGATFRDPYPAFSAAISVQFTVAGASSYSARQTHWPATGRAQMLWTQAVPTHGTHTDFQGGSCPVMVVTVDTDFGGDGGVLLVLGRRPESR
jgi:hypothetical protein